MNADHADREIAPPLGPASAFDGLTFTVFKRFIELISGDFQAINKDIDMEKATIGESVEREKHETDDTEIYEAQQFWVNRVNGFFMNTVGLLAGMSVLHLIVILSVKNKNTFL